MTINRNIDSDRYATTRIMQLVAAGQNGELEMKSNWLGHTRGSNRLDKALLLGATMTELKAIRSAINQHFDHLRDEHGLEVIRNGDVYRITVP